MLRALTRSTAFQMQDMQTHPTALRTSIALAALSLLAACASSPAQRPDFSAKNRPLEVRCFRAQKNTSQASRPGLTRAEVQAEAQAAARRGELDKACEAL